MEWRRDETLILIDAYQRNPCLWNANLKEHKKKYMRFAALTRMQQELSVINDKITHEDIKKKIHTLRGQYKREQKEKREMDKSGAATDIMMYMPKLWCYDLLHFLEDCNSRNTTSAVDHIQSQLPTCLQEIRREAATVDPHAPLPQILPSESSTSSQHSWANKPIPECCSTPPEWTNTLNTPMTMPRRSPTPPELNFTPSASPPPAKRRKKRRKIDGEDVSDALLDASDTRLWAPRGGGDDEFRTYGRSLGFDLRSISKKNPLQAKLARKVIGEIVFMASTDALSVDSKMLNIKPYDNYII